MPSSSETFVELIATILRRYCQQNGMPPLTEAARKEMGARLWVLVSIRGVPPRNAPTELAAPPEMKAEDVAPLVAAVLEDSPRATDLITPLRQLVKACFQAERTQCRESYHEAGADGVCRRQELERVRSRVSGSHCVDCPYWNQLDELAHAQLLSAAWCGKPEEFTANRDVFLPEDFRALRRWLRERSDQPGPSD